MMEKQDEIVVNLKMALDQICLGRLKLARSFIKKSLSLIESQNKQQVDDEIVRLLEAKE